MIVSRVVGVVVALLVGTVLVGGPAESAPNACAVGNPLQPTAELFATDNTATITEPDDQRLRNGLAAFELQVDGIALGNVGLPVGSTLVSGVFWSDERQQATYERSREFHLACVDAVDLHRIGDQVRTRFGQESVLTFRYLPNTASEADAFTVEVAGVDVRRFRDALVADREAREHLVGGSVTESGSLILVADLADFTLTQRFVTSIGGTWNPDTVHYGDREFVG
ncbi:hypothetical protein ACQPZ2_33865 [Nocardia pseudovaccinii]|uniref:hypothetical protein n=1 Tax=Nocardia pseudovaccinii TaxID=189540 RepID=UPI003D8BF3EA